MCLAKPKAAPTKTERPAVLETMRDGSTTGADAYRKSGRRSLRIDLASAPPGGAGLMIPTN